MNRRNFLSLAPLILVPEPRRAYSFVGGWQRQRVLSIIMDPSDGLADVWTWLRPTYAALSDFGTAEAIMKAAVNAQCGELLEPEYTRVRIQNHQSPHPNQSIIATVDYRLAAQ